MLCGCLEGRGPKPETFLDLPRVVHQACDHSWCAFSPASIHSYPKRAVRSNKVVGRGGQEETPFQTVCVAPGMPGATDQCGKSGSEGSIEPLDKGSVDCVPLPLSLLNHVNGLEQITKRQSA